MRKITKILALCAMMCCIPIMAYAAPETETGLMRYASDSNAEKPDDSNEQIKIQELNLSITCTKPNENMSVDNLLVDLKTEHCHIDKIEVVRYDTARIILFPDSGYRFSSNIREWTTLDFEGLKGCSLYRNYISSLQIEVTNNVSFEPSDGDTFQVAFDKYADKLKSIVSDINNNDINMSDANTADSIKQYIRNKLPNPPANEIELEVIIDTKDFRPASLETMYWGYCRYYIRIWKKNDIEVLEKISGSVSILLPDNSSGNNTRPGGSPRPSGGSSSSSGGGGSSSGGGGRSSSGSSSGNSGISHKTGLNVSKPSVTGGTWENVNGKWKLKAADGSYASSQWASLDGKWYLFGIDGMMQTNWQMVNEKWYLLGQDGSMLIGWQFMNDKWYFLGEDGAMLSATTTPDGYTVNENGEWVQ